MSDDQLSPPPAPRRAAARKPVVEPPANGRAPPLELTCLVQDHWRPLIRPAPATRDWMDATRNSYAYRCLPLNIANTHGWEILNPVAFAALWNGGEEKEAIRFRFAEVEGWKPIAMSHFGHGVLTFQIDALFRTPPGWNLWVGGSANRPKDAIQPLTGIVETDWSPFTFTMNWRFTRPRQVIRFDAMEPICSIFPVQRAALEAFEPRFAPMDRDPELLERYKEWSAGRDAFNRDVQKSPPKQASASWQKHYYRGVDFRGGAWVDDHKPKLRLTPFDRSLTPRVPEAPAADALPRRRRQGS